MDRSPKNRDIEILLGDPETIIARGKQITRLGDQMMSSAALLKSLHDGATGQKGLAVDKLKAKVGDSYEELRKAGERYQPTGPVLTVYGTALAETQPRVRATVTECEQLWETYRSKLAAQSDAAPGFRLPDLTPPSDAELAKRKSEDEAFDAAKAAAESAYEDWRSEAQRFDANYDTWEDAFEIAARGVGKATEGNISDGFWDNVDGFVAGLVKVLSVVGLILAIAAIVIGGPILAALAAIVAVATLALTVYQKVRGDASWGDLALAVIAVIPIGKLGVLFKGGSRFAGLGALAKGSPLNLAMSIRTVRGGASAVLAGGRAGFARAGGGFAGLKRGAMGMMKQANREGTVKWTDTLVRGLTGKSRVEIGKLDLRDPFQFLDLGKGSFDATKSLWTYTNNLWSYADNVRGR